MNIQQNKTAKKIAITGSQLIGNTPLFELTRTGAGSRLLLKLDQLNPTGSCKVRMAREMIVAAERDGRLKPGGRIVEPTSGNTGIGLAFVAIEHGYTFTAVVDNHASLSKVRTLKAMGSQLVFVEGDRDAPSTVERRRIASEIANDTDAFWPDQHYNPNNALGYVGLAEELWRDIGSDLKYLVGAVGTGGTLCGTVKELRRLGSSVFSIGVEPTGSIIFGGPPGRYWQTGAGAPGGFTVGLNVDYSVIDEGVRVDDVDAFTTARVVAQRTGLLVGGTAGAAIHVALKRLPLAEPGITMVALVCDGGEKYLDTIYNDDWLLERQLLSESAHRRVHGLFDAYWDSTTPQRRDYQNEGRVDVSVS